MFHIFRESPDNMNDSVTQMTFSLLLYVLLDFYCIDNAHIHNNIHVHTVLCNSHNNKNHLHGVNEPASRVSLFLYLYMCELLWYCQY